LIFGRASVDDACRLRSIRPSTLAALGCTIGRTMVTERLRCHRGATGKVRRRPMAMLPFMRYNMGDYFGIGQDTGTSRLRHTIFNVNGFVRALTTSFCGRALARQCGSEVDRGPCTWTCAGTRGRPIGHLWTPLLPAIFTWAWVGFLQRRSSDSVRRANRLELRGRGNEPSQPPLRSCL